ncbi:MAG: ATP-dependent helicase/nuclease subunit, partial [Clostridia bacterium]|nr:ATP-dependent helicase/nuclease subunit [Clostridia bacterium]
ERPWTFRSSRVLEPDPKAAGVVSSADQDAGAGLVTPAGLPAAGEPATLDPALAALNRYRLGATAHLRRLHRAVQGHTLTVRELTAALFNLLQELRVPRILAAWRQQALAAGELDAAQEHEQVWEGLMDLFDELVTGLGDTSLGLEEYAAILNAGMEGLKLRLIPPALDQVVVGTMDRSRQPELQAALVLGVGEGVLPARLPEDATFSDREREELQAAGVELAPTGVLRLYHEEYLAYLALTRSRRFLWLSYPLADAEGKALAPSPLVRRLRQLLPRLPEESIGLDLPGGDADLEYVTTPRQAAGYLARLFSRHQELPSLWREVYQWLAAHPEASRWLGLLRGSGYRNQAEPLEPGVVARLFPPPVHTSISRLETFAACPFRYFLAYGLKLQERENYQVDPAGMGQFYHAALKLFVEELQARGRDWGSLSDQEEAALLDRVMAALVPALQHEILSSSARYGYLRRQLTRTLQRVLGVLGEHARRGEFRPLLVEAAFGRGGELPPLELEVAPGQKIILEGRVDRIDVARYQGQPYLRVIDYKSSQTDVNLERVYYGLSLQLPLYLGAALAAAPRLLGTAAAPAGILYFAVRNPVVRQRLPVRGEAEVEKLHRQELKMRGLVLDDPGIIRLMDREVERNPDLLPVRLNKDGSPRKGSPVAGRAEMALLLELARNRAAGLAGAILAGRVDISPYRQGTRRGCEFCPYHPVCGFDLQIPGPAYRRLGVLKGEDFWQAARRVLREE